MNQKTFLKKLTEGYASNIQISKNKNADYADNDDAFKNFRACEMLGFTIEEGILIRMSDKFIRVSNLLKRKAVISDEKITDTLQDLANYAMILKVYIEAKHLKL